MHYAYNRPPIVITSHSPPIAIHNNKTKIFSCCLKKMEESSSSFKILIQSSLKIIKVSFF